MRLLSAAPGVSTRLTPSVCNIQRRRRSQESQSGSRDATSPEFTTGFTANLWVSGCGSSLSCAALPLATSRGHAGQPQQSFRNLYSFVVLVAIIANIVVQLNPHFGSDRWKTRRICTYAAVIGFGVCTHCSKCWACCCHTHVAQTALLMAHLIPPPSPWPISSSPGSCLHLIAFRASPLTVTLTPPDHRHLNATRSPSRHPLTRRRAVATRSTQVIPATHWALLNMDNGNIVGLFLPRIFGVYALIGTGVMFYVTHLPERVWPGAFDLLGSSHQWWHVFVMAAFVWWYYSGVDLRDYRHDRQCPIITE